MLEILQPEIPEALFEFLWVPGQTIYGQTVYGQTVYGQTVEGHTVYRTNNIQGQTIEGTKRIRDKRYS